MFAANLLKVVAVLMMIGGLNPVLAIGLAGVGAAIYAPAKYGLVTELLPAQALVRANGYFESATVCAVILGTAIGGFLISPAMPSLVIRWPADHAPLVQTALFAGLLVLLALNALALVLSAAVKDTGARYDAHPRAIGQNVRRFWSDNRQLWQDRLGGISMSVTTLLWAVGATMQLIILRWANESLGMSLTHAAYLQGVTAVGAICGAVLASRAVVLARAIEVMPVGILMGVLLPALLLIHQLGWAVALLVTLGVLAGFVVVPMNAVLQHRGCTLLSAGCSIAVQGFNENGGMLVLLGIYAVTVALALPLNILIFGFGVLVACGMAAIYFRAYAARTGAPIAAN
jgi:MFS family permease